MRRALTVRRVLGLWLALVLFSNGWRALHPPSPEPGELPSFQWQAQPEHELRAGVLVWREWPGDRGLPVLLLHGAPGDHSLMQRLPEHLGERRALAPDLPGYGRSSWRVGDHGVANHARVLRQWLQAQGLARVHVVGFSMGGGVAMELLRQEPERVASLTMLAAIGVQELELLGDYGLNHDVHRIQWLVIEAALLALPHFGALDRWPLNRHYALNFLHTDQRPFRDVLRGYGGPMLVLHGERDPLVPVAAAREHHRLVPQSELLLYDASHFLPQQQPQLVGPAMASFFDAVEGGKATTRADADPGAVAAAERPWVAPRPDRSGLAQAATAGLLAASTLVNEDLACIGAGLLVGGGRVSFLVAVLGCLAGIFLSDVGLFVLGRLFGRRALDAPPLSWMVNPEQVDEAERWIERHGWKVILVTRAVPGSRVPTYVAAGMLGADWRWFLLWFGVGTVLWTPLFVGAVAWLGAGAAHTLTRAVLLGLAALLLLRFGLPLLRYRRRMLAWSWLRRWTTWEFFPWWLLYPPALVEMLARGVVFGRVTAPLAVNPAIHMGGFVGESKWDIHRQLEAVLPHRLPGTAFVPARGSAEQRVRQGLAAAAAIGYPVMLKPAEGQRGTGVVRCDDEPAVADYLRRTQLDTLVQRRVEGVEAGLTWVRFPGEPAQLQGICEKRQPMVVADGIRSLERLILEHPRGILQAPVFLDRFAERLHDVPAAGTRIPLGVLGTHSLGCMFLDGERHRTPALEAAAREFEAWRGFHMGRLDVRAASWEALRRGEFLVIEVNGVTAEPGEMYDPRRSWLDGVRRLQRWWRDARAIGWANMDAGFEPASLGELAAEVRFELRGGRRGHPGPHGKG